ncbi:hypothetical protein BpHYR1_011986 [Brachionus plicatilis]|uniref:Uncharacterized protein n=1 Tax=Brachionus plicatilis TaxID=10195 RepID=A0A3M7S006_BRAPC|nr:hypothetical protein BpHYR1_011986 [Brachionus plicatilis]
MNNNDPGIKPRQIFALSNLKLNKFKLEKKGLFCVIISNKILFGFYSQRPISGHSNRRATEHFLIKPSVLNPSLKQHQI